jgi:prohibitin 2
MMQDFSARPMDSWARFRRAFTSTSLIFGLLAALLLIVLFPLTFVNVPSGHVGVLWLRFFGGTVTESHFDEGLKVVFPWNRIFLYDTRVRRTDETVEALTHDGLTVKVAVNILLMLNPESVGLIHKYAGPEYFKQVVVPFAVSNVREIISSKAAIDLFTTDRYRIETGIKDAIYTRLAAMGLPVPVVFKQVVVNLGTIELPATVQAAIEAKLTAAQNVQRYQFVLDSERLESQRKAIEADGIKQFQTIVAPTISDSYLKWRGIEATLKLAQSPNAKVVVIGNGPGGLPIILGNDPTAPAVAPGSTDTRPEVTGLDQLRARADKPAVGEGDTVGQSLSARDPRASGR